MGRYYLKLALLTAGMAASPAWASFFSSCEAGSDAPKPEWVSKVDFALPGYYLGVGVAEQNGEPIEERRKASETEAKSHLVEQIEVNIRAENQQSTQVTNNKDVQSVASAKVVVSAEEVLRDLKIKDRWVDKKTCAVYTLMVVSKDSVAQTRREKLMRTRLAKVKALLASGTDRDHNPNARVRWQMLDEARVLLDEIDFALINEAYSKAAYAKDIADALAVAGSQITETTGRVAVLALNEDRKIPPELLGRMLDQLRAADHMMDRLMVACMSVEECLAKAKDHGFGTLALLKVDSRVETSNMGALKGTLQATKTIFDTDSRKVVSGPAIGSAQVIGWGNEDLNWATAADKVMQDLK